MNVTVVQFGAVAGGQLREQVTGLKPENLLG
jgi:hypothetical protein